MEKKYLKLPPEKASSSTVSKILFAFVSLLLFLPSWLFAYYFKTPGLKVRGMLLKAGLYALFRKLDFINAFRLIVCPLDSVRYFEFDFMYRHFPRISAGKQLDVSSPRYWLYICASQKNSNILALNPDGKDLSITQQFIESMKLEPKFSFSNQLISEINRAEKFDVITCMSVLEHIPQDTAAVQIMWSLLRPGGTLLLTIPCAAQHYEEYTSLDDYQLLTPDKNGFVFWQRFYDQKLLERSILSVTGQPLNQEIYAEKRAGFYDRNVIDKRTMQFYPFWNEPSMMGREFQLSTSIDKLPGMGVVGLVFKKPIEE
jgi:SAM-dependent methyltransferase